MALVVTATAVSAPVALVAEGVTKAQAVPAQGRRRAVAASEPRSASASALGEAGSAW
jgi:hypothetical protein